MADDVLELADKLWRGDIDIVDDPPRGRVHGRAWPRSPTGVAFVPQLRQRLGHRHRRRARPRRHGLELRGRSAVHEALRGWSALRLNTAIYSHGHIDHVFGVGVWEEESADAGLARPGGRGP